MPQAKRKDDPIDILSARLIQARGVLIAIGDTYDDDSGYELPDEHMRSALWAVEELVRQAEEAFDATLDNRITERAELGSRRAA